MPITKQDINKIADALAKRSVKDSNFELTNSIDANTCIAVLANNKNRLVAAATLVSFFLDNVDLHQIPITIADPDIDGYNGTLYDLLHTFYKIIGTEWNPIVTSASNVGCSAPANTIDVTNVQSFINNVLNILYGVAAFPTSATIATIDGFDYLDNV